MLLMSILVLSIQHLLNTFPCESLVQTPTGSQLPELVPKPGSLGLHTLTIPVFNKPYCLFRLAPKSYCDVKVGLFGLHSSVLLMFKLRASSSTIKSCMESSPKLLVTLPNPHSTLPLISTQT